MITVIGLTGQSGSGKSFLSSRFSEKGIPVIDADEVSHRVTSGHTECLRTLRAAFGYDVFEPDGSLNRKKLGTVVFSDPIKLELLNRTVLPFITQEIDQMVLAEKAAGSKLLLLDAPTLYEAGADRLCSYVVAVCAPLEFRIRRIMERDSLTRESALLRISAQKDDSFYAKRADLTLYNDGTKEEFLQKADELIALLTRRFFSPEIK